MSDGIAFTVKRIPEAPNRGALITVTGSRGTADKRRRVSISISGEIARGMSDEDALGIATYRIAECFAKIA